MILMLESLVKDFKITTKNMLNDPRENLDRNRWVISAEKWK